MSVVLSRCCACEGVRVAAWGAGAGAGGRRRKSKTVTMANLNPNMVRLEYAVRGPLATRAVTLQQEIAQGKSSKPFKTVIRANLGDAHAMGSKPITFIRQVLAGAACPDIMDKADFPADVKERVNQLLSQCGGKSVGSYSASNGLDLVRRHVAQYIERRDGHASRPDDIVLAAGASPAIKYVLTMFQNNASGKPAGIMIPIPQYPLYSATIAEYGLQPIGYYLNEDKNWGLDQQELERSLNEGMGHSTPRAIVVINPGNPTGQVLTRENIEQIIKFAEKNNLFIFADEVYQDNIYGADSKFHSFKKVMCDMGPPYKDMELASFMTASKGYMGECGVRGGWMELVGLEGEVRAQLYKCISANLCPPILGQMTLDCIAKPPQEGEASYQRWLDEKTTILKTLKERSILAVDTFNSMEGFKCNPVQGAMYAFPKFELSQKAIDAAKKEKQKPDVFYAFRLLEEKGICIVAGSGFGQKEGTYHFRTTILPQTPLLKEMLEKFKEFHAKFTKEFS